MDSMFARPRMLALAAAAMTVGLAGCPDRGSLFSTGTTVPAQPSAPPINLAGRWLLASPGKGQCNMTFGATPGAAEGTIAPEGGCPGRFYTSRKWSFDSSGLVIRNHNSEPLAQLTTAGGQFSGQSTAGEPITLSR